jgi:hypothetical protein
LPEISVSKQFYVQIDLERKIEIDVNFNGLTVGWLNNQFIEKSKEIKGFYSRGKIYFSLIKEIFEKKILGLFELC